MLPTQSIRSGRAALRLFSDEGKRLRELAGAKGRSRPRNRRPASHRWAVTVCPLSADSRADRDRHLLTEWQDSPAAQRDQRARGTLGPPTGLGVAVGRLGPKGVETVMQRVYHTASLNCPVSGIFSTSFSASWRVLRARVVHLSDLHAKDSTIWPALTEGSISRPWSAGTVTT